MATLAQQKVLGAYYTDDSVAKFLVNWGVRAKCDSVLDPSCGEGAFVGVAIHRLRLLGAAAPDVWGVDIDTRALAETKKLHPCARLIPDDFFSITPTNLKSFSTVVGNPPFVRYQSFSGAARVAGLGCAARQGVRLPQLSSSWAPFLVHAVSFVRPGGRLAMVVPAELGHAQYAVEVLRFVCREFARVKICMFRSKLFPKLSENTYLLLAEERGKPCQWFSVSNHEDIDSVQASTHETPVDVESVRSGRVRLNRYLLSSKARQIYDSLSEQTDAVRLGNEADVGIGYVTGANDFFHLSEADARGWKIPRAYLRPAILSLVKHDGIIVRKRDWNGLRDEDAKCFLLALPPTGEDKLPPGVRAYIRNGTRSGIQKRFKCRVREHWYSVPHVRQADALLSYMAGRSPKLLLNPSGLVATNTLHLVRFVNKKRGRRLIAGWCSSLTRLSCELEGHALGGGLLKLEPSEAERILVALPREGQVESLLGSVDEMLRSGRSGDARELVDRSVLRGTFGLSATECARLAEGATFLADWRLHR